VSNDIRSRILDLAVAAVDAGGEAAIRVNDIASEAGVTPPALYYHFGSRDGLVVAAQVERFSRRAFEDIAAIEKELAKCTSRDALRAAFIATWKRIIENRISSRWVRTSALGSAYARPELEVALAKAQDEIIVGLCRILEPFRDRGWLRAGIDLESAVAWQHSVLIGRVYIERGQAHVDPAEWDRLTLEALVQAFFGV
jgi:AcrR family transcriptional regulator